jgi:natural product biosynthesis luciferase-like monooxygenase protein
MDFGVMCFSSDETAAGDDKYAFLKAAARFADSHDLCAVWTPERHFHPFGGLYPNPALTSAALAMITQRVALRAGSLVSPLHDVIRIAEEWAVVDNLSHGRVAVSFGSGWNAGDFVLFPDRYARRRAVMYEQIDAVQRLWRGEPLTRADAFGKTTSVVLHPRPVQSTLPVWITSSGSPETSIEAGARGANLLTHLLGQDVITLAERIRAYREARREAGFDPGTGIVSLMLHTFIDPDLERVRRLVRTPFREYLRSAISLERRAAAHGGSISGGKQLPHTSAVDDVDEELLDIAFERYFHTAALMGTPERCREIALRLEEIGVNEIACLIDFGVEPDAALGSLEHLADLAAALRASVVGASHGR